MTEIDELIRQRDELNAKIKELLNKDIVIGHARYREYNKERVGMNKNYPFVVDVAVNDSASGRNRKKFRYSAVVKESSRAMALERLDAVISDLMKIKEEISKKSYPVKKIPLEMVYVEDDKDVHQ